MSRKTILLELPIELIDKIDRLNTFGDRSAFVTELIQKQLESSHSNEMDSSTQLTTKMIEDGERLNVSGELNIITTGGISLGKFNINTLEGFEGLAKKIKEVSEHPLVQIRAENWR